ncbi:V-type ATP synthase subunit K, partial [Candidatus Micrarchaeota archaeon]|nr:V-type ATP synthase subunit K [Candidatus Micrarchaeota archaeon]
MAEAAIATAVGESGMIALGAGLAIGLGALGTAWAQSAIGSSGMGLIAEKPEEFTKVLICLALPETLVILGFVIAFFL